MKDYTAQLMHEDDTLTSFEGEDVETMEEDITDICTKSVKNNPVIAWVVINSYNGKVVHEWNYYDL